MRTSLFVAAALALAACGGPRAGQNIPDQPQITTDRQSMNWSQYVGETRPATLMITNDGAQDLVLSSVTLTDDAAGVFGQPQVSQTTIKHGDQGFVQIAFGSNSAGTYTAKLHIASNAANHATVDIGLSGTVATH